MFFRKCCFCFDLRHGTLAVGLFFMMASAIGILLEGGLLGEWQDIETQIANHRIKEFSQPAIITGLALTIVYLILNILLLQGVKEENKWYVLPWILWSILFVLSVVASAVYHYCTDDLDKAQRISVPIIYFFIFFIWIYCIMCVWSYYSELGERMPCARDSEDVEEGIPFVQLSMKPQKIHPHSIWEDESSLSSDVDYSRQQQSSKKKREEGRTNIRVKYENAEVHDEKGHKEQTGVDYLLDYGGVDLDPA